MEGSEILMGSFLGIGFSREKEGLTDVKDMGTLLYFTRKVRNIRPRSVNA